MRGNISRIAASLEQISRQLDELLQHCSRREHQGLEAELKKIYLGDGAYAEVDEYAGVVLTTSDGVRDTNRIVLDASVLGNFIVWLRHVGLLK